jgi:hypothetical protein
MEAEKPQQRVSLFYLANDIIQNAKRKRVKPFVEGWKDVLAKAVTYAG